MYSQRVSGMPQRCCNRTCRASFTKSSHCGYEPKSETEVYAIMHCNKCGDTFKVSQMIMLAHSYKQKLPVDVKTRLPRANDKPISLQEIDKVRAMLDSDKNHLKDLLEGHKPGGPNKIDFNEEV